MEEHIRALLQRFQYSEQFKETAAFRIVYGGEVRWSAKSGQNWVVSFLRHEKHAKTRQPPQV